MADNIMIPTFFLLIFVSRLIIALGKSKPLIALVPPILTAKETLSPKLRTDPEALKLAATDYGHVARKIPSAVLYPTSQNDIISLVKSANNASVPFGVSARGEGHSVRGQAMVQNGVVVNMTALKVHRGVGISIAGDSSSGFYADVGGEMLWWDLLHMALDHGLSPVSWTDYLHLSVGGTLSNAGISGTTFRYGPQISNVLELEVITGKGELVTCSTSKNSELFFAVLGGLGQFGIIVRARILLEPAPKRVKWVRMLYSDFSAFTGDQERLIKINERKDKSALDYLEGSLLMNQGSMDNWRSSFFPPSDHPRIIAKVTHHEIIYCLEVAKYYDDASKTTIDTGMEMLLRGLRYESGFKFEKDVAYVDFLDRVRSGEVKLQSQGLWEVPHPWLNLFIPKTSIQDFNAKVFKDIVLKRNITTGPLLFYPMNKNKWDDRMSAVVPEEDVFYTVGFLHSSGLNDWEVFDDQNKEILSYCENAGIEVKQYLPFWRSQEDWMKHFGHSKWRIFNDRKTMFDPNKILSRGQRIFNHHS